MLNKTQLKLICDVCGVNFINKFNGIQKIDSKKSLFLFNDVNGSTKAVKYCNNELELSKRIIVKNNLK